MLRRLLLPSALLAVSLVAVSAGNAGTSGGHALSGVVGPGFSIEVKQGTKDVKTLKAGTYTIKVQDKASTHDFHLTGPGVDKSTAVGTTSTVSWTVKLKPGTYTYKCDPHAAMGMQHTFRVTK